MKKVREVRQPGGSFNVYEQESGPTEIYVDGTVGTILSPGVVKIELHTSTGVDSVESTDEVIERRILTHRLVMPVTSFMEMCANSLATLKANEESFIDAYDGNREKIKSLLGNIKKK